MQTSYEMFLLAAKTLNFTKAASLAHITQQSFSEHIKKLEKEVGTVLFTRSPRVALTESGRIFYETVRQMDLIERRCLVHLKEREAGTRGHVRLGTNAARAKCFLPDLLERYHKAYPAVTVETVLGDTRELEPLLEEGRLDVLLGVDCTESALFHRIPVGTEALYLVGNREYVKGHLKKGRAVTLQPGSVVSLHDFENLTILGKEKRSTVYSRVTEVLKREGLFTAPLFSISDDETQFELARRKLGVTFCSQLHLTSLFDAKEAPLTPLSVKEITDTLRTDLVTAKAPYEAPYLTAFLEESRRVLQEKYAEIRKFMAKKGWISDSFNSYQTVWIFFEIYSKMVWQESERMLLEEPRHEDLNKRSVCPASHAGSCHEWQGKLCSHPQCIRTTGNLREIFGANHYCPLQSQTGQERSRRPRRL